VGPSSAEDSLTIDSVVVLRSSNRLARLPMSELPALWSVPNREP
jgi:hypothetical protein